MKSKTLLLLLPVAAVLTAVMPAAATGQGPEPPGLPLLPDVAAPALPPAGLPPSSPPAEPLPPAPVPVPLISGAPLPSVALKDAVAALRGRRIVIALICSTSGSVRVRVAHGAVLGNRRFRCRAGESTVGLTLSSRRARRLRMHARVPLRLTFTVGEETLRRGLTLRTRPRARSADYPLSGPRVNCLYTTQTTTRVSPLLSVGQPEIFALGIADEWTAHLTAIFQYTAQGWRQIAITPTHIWGKAPMAGTAGSQYGNGWWYQTAAGWQNTYDIDFHYPVAAGWYQVASIVWRLGSNGAWSTPEWAIGNHHGGATARDVLSIGRMCGVQ